jgi:LmbE family N-acetylglucosaminyl deacetylase
VLVEVTPERAVAVYAHPDDAEVGCGGTLARWASEGADVHIVVCCRGDKGTSDPQASPAEVIAQRAAEVGAAAAALGVAGHEMLDHPDGELEDTGRFRFQLVELVRRLRPDIVICPDPEVLIVGGAYVNHRDHRVAGGVALDAVAPAARMPLYYPEAGPPHVVRELWLSGSPAADVHVDIGGPPLEAKTAALACHESQVGPHAEFVDEVVRARAEEAGAAAGVRYAESFRRITLL